MEQQINPGVLIDNHLHSLGTVDGKMTEAQACQQAVRMGMKEITFTNHAMLTEPEYKISSADFVKHWENIQVCQQLYPKLTIRLGLEVDYYEGRERDIAADIQHYEKLIGRPLDLILGAIHHLNGVFFSSQAYAPDLYNNHEIGSLYQDYFAMATLAVRSHLFDVMAHPDLIKKFTGELAQRVPYELYHRSVEPYIDALIACDVGIEINTKGFSQKVGEAYPTEELLDAYLSNARVHSKEPIITIGSDAHNIQAVGKYVTEGLSMLGRHGQKTIMRFEKRKAIPFLI